MNMNQPQSEINPARGRQISRRFVLAAAPALAACTPAAASLIPDADQGGSLALEASHDPIPRWFSEWKQNKAAWRETEPESSDEQRLWKRAEEIERQILASRARSPGGMAAQIEYALEEGLCGDEMGGSFEGLDRKMFEGIAEALRGMATDVSEDLVEGLG